MDRIKADASVRKEIHTRQLTRINSDTKARRDAGNQEQADMSVCIVIILNLDIDVFFH